MTDDILAFRPGSSTGRWGHRRRRRLRVGRTRRERGGETHVLRERRLARASEAASAPLKASPAPVVSTGFAGIGRHAVTRGRHRHERSSACETKHPPRPASRRRSRAAATAGTAHATPRPPWRRRSPDPIARHVPRKQGDEFGFIRRRDIGQRKQRGIHLRIRGCRIEHRRRPGIARDRSATRTASAGDSHCASTTRARRTHRPALRRIPRQGRRWRPRRSRSVAPLRIDEDAGRTGGARCAGRAGRCRRRGERARELRAGVVAERAHEDRRRPRARGGDGLVEPLAAGPGGIATRPAFRPDAATCRSARRGRR